MRLRAAQELGCRSASRQRVLGSAHTFAAPVEGLCSRQRPSSTAASPHTAASSRTTLHDNPSL